ncbi:MAG: type I restriction-modification system subunit M N-terminal domain-containing protein, partial [Bacteroidota bacterium]
MLTSTLKTKVQDLWDKFWSGGISNPLNAIEQITYLLFMKQLDENDQQPNWQSRYQLICQQGLDYEP